MWILHHIGWNSIRTTGLSHQCTVKFQNRWSSAKDAILSSYEFSFETVVWCISDFEGKSACECVASNVRDEQLTRYIQFASQEAKRLPSRVFPVATFQTTANVNREKAVRVRRQLLHDHILFYNVGDMADQWSNGRSPPLDLRTTGIGVRVHQSWFQSQVEYQIEIR